ncbi:galactose mutarotase [Halovulum dunhuangense]|uniref:Aldose 1-epimerase n=1 Tax=Halovulum dunhuangense TaxID=1505036 RepID=A0A849L2L0_9RHOB|nr:aldose epimerase family protein [Halovulum dunhuangense]NNU80503.1 galactose mutarotase [Halovulum dunhuangense]
MTRIRSIGAHEGASVEEAVLDSGQARIAIMNYGCVIRDWRVEAGGRAVPCVLGFEKFAPYPEHSKSFGIIAGRVANRTAAGRFSLDGRTYQLPVNNGPNHLHGGPVGLGKRIWEMASDGPDAVILHYHSPDGEMGYPGAVDFEVRFSLKGARLTCEMTGHPDRPTPINLAQHNYYNLNGAGDILRHRLQIAASRYTPVDATLIPTGEIAPVAGTQLDFRQMAEVGAVDPGRIGADHNLVLDEGRDPKAPAAVLESDLTGLRLRVWTEEPGIQLFTAQPMQIAVPGHDGVIYGPFGGLCLEAQHFPDSLNHPEWPSMIATPDRPYRQRLELEIAPL